MAANRQLRAVDGFTLGAYEAMPADNEPKGALVIIQEIFGVNSHIRDVCDRYANEGYAAIAPQIFDRAQRDVELGYGEGDLGTGFNLAFQETDRDATLRDLQAAVEEAGKWGQVGVIGYCYGGLLAWLSACELRGVSAAVAYYGGGIANELSREPRCPVMMHFGAQDALIPMDQVDAIRSAQPDASVFVYDADHGFNCDQRESFHEESANVAFERTRGFLREKVASVV